MNFERINLFCSELSEHAISSLVLSVPNLLELDLRGNRLTAQFGWSLIKAMKKKYLNLRKCNGVGLQDLRTNSIETLNLSSFKNHHGMFGIEVVGAIFLAHFLRLNTSLKYFNFSRNEVEKDGAKALAQCLITNAQCALVTVNTMGPLKKASKPGIDFQQFRAMTLKVVHLGSRLLDDDDMVFLEEWLRKYDCVEDLDVSNNVFYDHGVRKLARYVKDTRTLRKLNCTGLPVDLAGSELIVQAVVQNQTLEQAALPLGPCDGNVQRHQMFQQLGLGLQNHPSMTAFASGRPGSLEWANLGNVRSGQQREFPPQRSGNWPPSQMATYMWLMAGQKPLVEKFVFGAQGRPCYEYPSSAGTPFELWPIVPTLIHDLSRTLTSITVNVGTHASRDIDGPSRVMELMRVLTRCTALRTLNLLAYGSAVMKERELPQEWLSVGSVPKWLMDDWAAKQRRVHWQALHGLLSTNTLGGLEAFNEIPIGGNLKDQPELTVLLLLQCLPGVACHLVMEPQPGGEVGLMEARLQKQADVEAFCDVLRLLGRQALVINLTFVDKKVEVVKSQQAKLSAPLSGIPSRDGGPIFPHTVVLKNAQTSEQLLKSIDCRASLKEFGYENISMTLPALWAALCGKEQMLPVERIRIETKWDVKSIARKRFSDKQRTMLKAIWARLVASQHFQMLQSSAQGEVDQREIAEMSEESGRFSEFVDLISGKEKAEEELPNNEKHAPRIPWLCFKSYHDFASSKTSDDPAPQMYVSLPLDQDSLDLQLQKLSLCMCDLRTRLANSARPDEWPGPSKPIWDGPQRLVRPGAWDEHELRQQPPSADDDVQDEDRHVRFHWRPGSQLRIGTHNSCTLVEQALVATETPFADKLLRDGLASLLSEQSTLTWLDVRGNGLTREDADELLKLIETHNTLVWLNQIPVVIDEAKNTRHLIFDGSGVDKKLPDGEDQDYQEPEREAFAREALVADYVRMDEGDGFLFYSLVTPQYFTSLVKVVFKRIEIPQAFTLAFITDALLNLTTVRELVLSELKLSGRGASLLLQAIAEMAQSQHLESLNGLPLARLMTHRDGSAPIQLPAEVEWNDFPLGAMARLNLWPFATLPVNASEGGFNFQGKYLTDVGLKGLCVMLRHFAGTAQSASAGGLRSGPSPSLLSLTKLDLSSNGQITDETVADLCHTLQHPSTGASLRHSLRELSVRSCTKLKARSALELQSFVMHLRDGTKGADGGGLQIINGLDLEALQSTGRSAAAGGRREGLPAMTLRTFVVPEGAYLGKEAEVPKYSTLSECDILFYAAMLHLWPHIPYCHIHVVLPLELQPQNSAQQGGFMTWAREGTLQEDGVFGGHAVVTNDSPFPAPSSAAKKTANIVQAHFDAARRLFEACPVNMQLRLSVSPAALGCEKLLAQGDDKVLGLTPSTANVQSPHSSYAEIKRKFQATAQARRKLEARQCGETVPANAAAPRALYVNNINSQRMHCHFRTLYGKDEVDIQHRDIMPDERCDTCLPGEVDISQAFAVATSVDLQHLELSSVHLEKLSQVQDMPVLTHINLNHNLLGDAGVDMLFKALVEVGSSVVHVALASNGIGDEGATTIAVSLGSLPRLTSLELCDNFIQERGSIAIADAIGGYTNHDDTQGGDDGPHAGPLPVLSVDLRGNRSRELGARRWAEVVTTHPDLKFLCLAQNEIGLLTEDRFLDLVCAAFASSSLSVLDLQDNFPHDVVDSKGKRHRVMGPPPPEVVEELLQEFVHPNGEFDPNEVRKAVFIRRHRGAGGSEKKGRQPVQGQGGGQRHPPTGSGATPSGASLAGSPSVQSAMSP